ncbi:MAG: hypothetical protein IJ941_02195, partial [Clostridia bacterium]|nr:hypothetical protein [Clostridia bacterium]
MRLFIAIELPASFKNEVARIQKEVKQMSSGGRFVPRDNFHITLHFIGESEDLVGVDLGFKVLPMFFLSLPLG